MIIEQEVDEPEETTEEAAEGAAEEVDDGKEELWTCYCHDIVA